jgi:hypothetical protein
MLVEAKDKQPAMLAERPFFAVLLMFAIGTVAIAFAYARRFPRSRTARHR